MREIDESVYVADHDLAQTEIDEKLLTGSDVICSSESVSKLVAT